MLRHNCVHFFLIYTRPSSQISVDQIEGMLGTFAPQRDPYEHSLEEETTPSGSLARGIYSAKLKVNMIQMGIM